MPITLRTAEIILNDDGTVRAIRAHYEDVDNLGRAIAIGTRRLDATALAVALPDRAALLAEIEALHAADAARAEALAAAPSVTADLQD